MSRQYFAAQDRGRTWVGWLRSYHSFSFGNYYNPDSTNFGALLVLNDDEIAPGAGFDTHPHSDMEIVTIPLAGQVKHEDSTGTSGLVGPGEVQIMSAGTGIFHSEVNASKDEFLKLLQIWVLPNIKGLQPRYDQKKFDPEKAKDRWQILVSPDERDGSLKIFQQAYFSLTIMGSDQKLEYVIQTPGNLAFVFVIDGVAKIGDQPLSERDSLGINGEEKFEIHCTLGAKILVIEIPIIG